MVLFVCNHVDIHSLLQPIHIFIFTVYKNTKNHYVQLFMNLYLLK